MHNFKLGDDLNKHKICFTEKQDCIEYCESSRYG